MTRQLPTRDSPAVRGVRESASSISVKERFRSAVSRPVPDSVTEMHRQQSSRDGWRPNDCVVGHDAARRRSYAFDLRRKAART